MSFLAGDFVGVFTEEIEMVLTMGLGCFLATVGLPVVFGAFMFGVGSGAPGTSLLLSLLPDPCLM